MAGLWQWLTHVENPIKLYGFFPIMLWISWAVTTLLGFAFLETLGVKRYQGMVPLTWFIRCGPVLAGLFVFGIAIWHFCFVTTKP